MDSSAQNERNMEGANPVLAHTDEQTEKWIAAKVDGGAYLEYLIRRLFATIRLIQASQAKQEQSYISAERRQEAANILLELDDLQIQYPASLHALYVRMSVELTVDQADKFVWEQFRLWMRLNAASVDYRGGVNGVELAAADLKYILKKTLESAAESFDEEDQEGTHSDGTTSVFPLEGMSTLRGPAAFDMITRSTEYQECDPALREEFHKNVNCCKQGMVEEARDEMWQTINDIAGEEWCTGTAKRLGKAVRKRLWHGMKNVRRRSFPQSLALPPPSARVVEASSCRRLHMTPLRRCNEQKTLRPHRFFAGRKSCTCFCSLSVAPLLRRVIVSYAMY